MSDMSRAEAIEILKREHEILTNAGSYTKVSEALRLAIASLETDEAYQLEYEQPEFCADCISREYVEEMIDRCYAASWNENDFYDRLMAELEVTPSVLPKADKPTIIDWNNCHTSEQLESIATTKNDLGVDAISRADARSLICDIDIKHHTFGMSRKAFKDLYNGIDELPPVTPIRPKGHWIEHDWEGILGEGYYRCSVCNHGYQRYTKGIRKSDVPYINGKEYTLWNIDNYCPNCGADMREVEE